MGVLFGAICLDCLEEGPEVGDFGFIGYPSISTDEEACPSKWDKDSTSPWEKNFGFIYIGLEAFKMLTFEVEAFQAFLVKHQGHRIYKFCDHAAEFPPEINNEDETKYATTSFVFKDDNFISAKYWEIHCEECNSTHQGLLDNIMRIRPFEPFVITAEEINLFKKHVLMGETTDYQDNFGQRPYLLDPIKELTPLKKFLKYHEHHKMVIRLSDTEKPKSINVTEKKNVASTKITDSVNALKEFKKKYSLYKLLTALFVAIFFGFILFGRKIVSPTSTIGTVMAGIIFLLLPILWLIARFSLLKCPNCNKSFLLRRFIPEKCPKCNTLILINKTSKA